VGFRYRRRFKIPDGRLNFSKNRFGISAGTGRFHLGIDSSGRRFTSVSIPRGFSWRTSNSSSGRGQLLEGPESRLAGGRNAHGRSFAWLHRADPIGLNSLASPTEHQVSTGALSGDANLRGTPATRCKKGRI
jgi:hypothetical protein